MDSITLTIADYDAEGSSHVGPISDWAAAVTERTNGKVTFDEYYSGSLIPGNEVASGVGDGVADIGRIVGSFHPEEMPVSNWMLQLGSTASDSYPHGMLQGSATSHEFITTNEVLVDEFANLNLVPLMGINPSQAYDLLCTKPIETAEDAQGLRSRSLGQIWVDEAEALGMEPVPLGTNEVYEGLQRGVVDCALYPIAGHIDYSLWEIASHYVPAKQSALNSLQMVINKDTWESLPTEVQDIMNEELAGTWGEMNENALAGYERFATEGPAEHDITVSDPRELDEILTAHQEEVVANMVNNAPPQVEDPQAFVDDYLAAQEKWLAVITDDMGYPLNERDSESLLQSYIDATEFDVDGFVEHVFGAVE